MQRDPIKGFLEHVDLVVVRRGEKVIGRDRRPRRRRGRARDAGQPRAADSLLVEAEATNIPTGVEVSVDGLTVGSQIHAKDVALPAGVTLVTDPEALVVNITAAVTAEQLEAELAEAEAEVGIVHEATDEEQAAEADEAAGEAGGDASAADGGDSAGDGAS